MGVARRRPPKETKSRAVRFGPLPPEPSPQRTIRIPEELAKEIEARIRPSGFESADAFVSYVLARLIEQRSEEPFSAEDEAKLRERLRSLGYID